MTALPEQADSPPLCNTQDLVLIHKVLRYGFSEAESLVRGVAEGDIKRADIVADHVLTISSGLHLHHEGEDEILWDTLEQRSPGCAIHVSLMRAHHAEIAARSTALVTVQSLAKWDQPCPGSSGRTVIRSWPRLHRSQPDRRDGQTHRRLCER